MKRARRQRRQMSLPEVLLWGQLRRGQTEFKFRKQHPIGLLTLDFACLSARLCIEVDGEAHSRGDQPEFDVERDTLLERLGFMTLRLPATVVLRDMDSALTAIVALCRERHPLHHRPKRAGGPPPRSGEDQGRDRC